MPKIEFNDPQGSLGMLGITMCIAMCFSSCCWSCSVSEKARWESWAKQDGYTAELAQLRLAVQMYQSQLEGK